MFFIDSRNVGRSIYRSLLQGLQHGHLLEFLVYDDKFTPSASGMGMVHKVEIFDDGADVMLKYFFGHAEDTTR